MRNKIIVGHYGSGKTEFSVNYALKLKQTNENVSIIDLDIVNPYFRSRERWELLEENNIKVIGGNLGHLNLNSDLPALSGEIGGYIDKEDYINVLDVGGDGVGAKVLSRYSKQLTDGGYEMYMVINANRPNTKTVEDIKDYIKEIEFTSRLKVSGIINNTHMLNETTIEDILKGHKLALEVCSELDLEIFYNIVTKNLNFQTISSRIDRIFVIEGLKMRPDWL